MLFRMLFNACCHRRAGIPPGIAFSRNSINTTASQFGEYLCLALALCMYLSVCLSVCLSVSVCVRACLSVCIVVKRTNTNLLFLFSS